MTEKPSKSNCKEVEAAVAAVVVMEDRAQVTRRAILELEPGRHLLSITPVTPLATDRSLRCRITPAWEDAEEEASDARLLDLQLVRRYVVKPARPEQERELTAAMENLAEEYRAALDQNLARFHERHLVSQAATALAAQVQDRLVVGPFDQRWPGEIEQLFARRAEVEQQILDDQWQQDDRHERYRDLSEQRRQVLQPVHEYNAELLTEVRVQQAGQYRLVWEYQVPCAVWRPSYTASLDEGGDGAAVSWQSAGMVWQHTGEDWIGVRLSLSTDRPTLGADLPVLHDDVLATREKTRREKDVIEVTSRDREIARTTTVDEKRSDTPPGLDDGGETRTFTAPDPVVIPSDGRPHRIIFETWEADCAVELACLPEKARHVFLRSLQRNRSAMPLLAGPVSLIRGGGFIGRSQISYVAPREKFSLSWGSEDGLVVLRHRVAEREETTLLKHRKETFKVELYLANHTRGRHTVRLTERVPISEIEQVRVTLQDKNTTPGFTRDDQGLLTWELDLPAGDEREVTLSFQVSMPPNVHWDR